MTSRKARGQNGGSGVAWCRSRCKLLPPASVRVAAYSGAPLKTLNCPRAFERLAAIVIGAVGLYPAAAEARKLVFWNKLCLARSEIKKIKNGRTLFFTSLSIQTYMFDTIVGGQR